MNEYLAAGSLIEGVVSDADSEAPNELEALRARVSELTERLRAARGSEEIQRAVLEGVPDYILELDTEGRIRFMNQTAPGFELEGVLGMPIFDFLSEESREPARRCLEQVLETEEAGAFDSTGLGPHRRLAHYHARLAPLTRGDGTRSLVMVATDITELRQAQLELKDSQERLHLTMAASGIGIWSWDREGDRIRWDTQTCRLFGVEEGWSPGSFDEYLALIHPDDRDAVRGAIFRSVETGVYEDIQHRIETPEGSTRWVLCKGDAQTDESGQVTRLLGAIVDVSDRRALEEQLLQSQKMEAVGQLAAGVAHNFNNMLAAILPNLELASRRAAPDIRRLLDAAREASTRAARIVRQLMLFAGGRHHAEQRRSEALDALVERTVEMCRNTFDRGIGIELRRDPALLPVRADSTQLEQVVLNALLNARDALDEVGDRERRIWVSVESISADDVPLEHAKGEWIRVRIEDNGAGIPAELRRRVFEPFFTTKEVGKGTGLGLATSYAIVREHGGVIDCSAGAEHGTVIDICLPADPSPEKTPSTPAPPETVGGKEHVLLVDDEALVRGAVLRVLEEAGYSVATAGDGAEALERFGRDTFDLVLLDLSLPRLSGRQVLSELRRQHPQARVICFSGTGETPPDANAFLDKPVGADTLLATVRDVLDAS
ncbi:MAG: PAS domain S-box protein [Myxococcales bacterium]|nr:PAS domain S-box protein [Myxococcales bacterium]